MRICDLPFFPTTGGDGAAGKDGVSPTITVTDIVGGHRLTIVDTIGTKTVDVLDGVNGAEGKAGSQGPAGIQGPAGQDGVNAVIKSVSATVDNSTGAPTVSVTAGGTESERTFAFSFAGLKGAKGDRGEQGIPGNPGDPGTPGVNGIDGKDGKDGTNGQDGKDGVGIASITINDAGELVITYTNNEEVNLGKVVGEQGIQGERGPQGQAYTLTAEDKAEIVTAVLAELSTQA